MTAAIQPNDRTLHLPSLEIDGFRGIDRLSISRLGRVTLVAGENGSGKTTILDAVRMFAARGRYGALAEILRDREEIIDFVDDEGEDIADLDWEALFFGRDVSDERRIKVGPSHSASIILQGSPMPRQTSFVDETGFSEYKAPSISVRYKCQFHSIPTNRRTRNLQNYRLSDGVEFAEPMRCTSLGPGLPSNSDIERFWNVVALTDYESLAIDALNLIFGGRVQRVAVVGRNNIRGVGGPYDRRVVVRVDGHDKPIPMKSLGDGAVRLFGVALALVNSQNGFLLIDEAENGIHHSLQKDFWKMIIAAADANNVQVLATTHSWDCVSGFALAAKELNAVDSLLVRIERDDDNVRAVEYCDEDLQVVAEQGIEVR